MPWSTTNSTVEKPAPFQYRDALASIHINLTALLRETGRAAEAEKVGLNGVSLWQALLAEKSKHPDLRRSLAKQKANLGLVYIDLNRLDAAEIEFEESLKLRKKLFDDFNKHAEFAKDVELGWNALAQLAVTYQKRGNRHFAAGEFTRAEADYRSAATRFTRLADANPKRLDFRRTQAECYLNHGAAFSGLNRPMDAVITLKKAVELGEALVSNFPKDARSQHTLSSAHFNVANVLHRSGRLKEAGDAYHKAISAGNALNMDSNNAAYRSDLADTYYNLASLHRQQNEIAVAAPLLEKALVHYDAAVKTRPETLNLGPKFWMSCISSDPHTKAWRTTNAWLGPRTP